MGSRKVARLVDALSTQPGVTAKPTKSGWILLLPDGTSTALHRSPSSDRRAMRNLRARLQRAGVDWPRRKE